MLPVTDPNPRYVSYDASNERRFDVPFLVFADKNSAAKGEVAVTFDGAAVTDYTVDADWNDGVGYNAVVVLPTNVTGTVEIWGDREPRRDTVFNKNHPYSRDFVAGLNREINILQAQASEMRHQLARTESDQSSLSILKFIPYGKQSAIIDGTSTFDIDDILADAAVEADGRRLRFGGGLFNLANLTMTVPARGLRLIGDGATLRQTSTDDFLMLIDGAYGTHHVIAGITTNTSYVYDEAADASTVSVIELGAESADLEVGDIVKIYSTDEILNARPGTGGTARRRGEFATIVSITDEFVTLSAKLKDTYTTSPKLVKMIERPFDMTGFILDQTDAAFTSTSFKGLIRTRGLFRPKVDIDIRRARGACVQFMGAFQPISHLVGGHLTGNTVDGQYAYLTEDVACEGGRYSSSSYFSRHGGLTTNTYDVLSSVSANLLATYCGKTRQALVHDSIGFGGFNSPFDVHEESEGVHFRNCHSRNTIEGRESQGSGFNFRSQICTTEGCTSENDNIGVVIHETIAGSTAGGAVTLRGMEVRNARKKAVQAVTFGSGTRVSGVRIEGGLFHAIEGPALDLSDADVETFGGTFKSDTGAVISAINGTVLKQTDPQVIATNGACVDWDATSSYEHIRGEFRGGQTGQIFTSSTGAVYKNSGRFKAALLGSAASSAIYRIAQDQTVKWLDGARIDLSDFSGSNPRIFRAAGTGATVKARGVIVERGAAGNPILFDGASVTGHSVSIEAAIDGNAPASGFGDYGTTNLHASVVPRIKLRADDKNTELITVPFTSAAQTPTLTFGFNAESEFTLYCTLDCDDEEDPEAFVMPDWPDGLEGQRMNVIVNPTGAGNTLAMTHAGTTNRLNRDGATVTLTGDDYEGARYIFTNGNWRQIS